RLRGLHPVRSGAEAVEVNAMHDHRVWHLQIGGRLVAGCNHPIHPADEETGPARMMALRCRGENKLQRGAKDVAKHHARQHFRVAARVPDALGRSGRPPKRPRHLPPAQLGQVIRQAGAQRCYADLLRLQRHELDDGAGHTRKALLEVGYNDMHPRKIDWLAGHASPQTDSYRADSRCASDSRAAMILSMRRPSMSTTSKRQPSTSTLSPVAGRCARWESI